jgi:hypothetical protein
MMKQAANLMVFQKYFDQWDYSDKLLGDSLLQIILNNWSPEKVEMILGEKPTELFYSKIFAKYRVVVEEADLTPTQQNLQAQQMLDINQAFGREVFPPSMIIPKLNITGKGEINQFLQQQEQQMSQQAQAQTEMQMAFENAKLQELMSKATNNIAMARERHGRSSSNVGLYEERLSAITRNRSLAIKDKIDALQKLIEMQHEYGFLQTILGKDQIAEMENEETLREDREKADAKLTDENNRFVQELLGMQDNFNPEEQMDQGMQEEEFAMQEQNPQF